MNMYIDLPAKVLNYFLISHKININQSIYMWLYIYMYTYIL